MRKYAVISLIVLCLAGGGGWLYFESTRTDEAILIASCEETLKDRLKSPSSYKRIRTTTIRRSLATLDDYLYADNPDRKRREEEQAAKDSRLAGGIKMRKEIFAAVPQEKLSLSIEYDAANSYGTPIRGFSECAAFVDQGTSLRGRSFVNARVDGATSLEWAMEAYIASKG